MTYRERRERRADRLRTWADSRERKAEIADDVARQILDVIPMGQPILVGHHSERRHRRDLARVDAALHAQREHRTKAADMRSRAAEIERQADAAIYRDDPDAPDRLRAKLADLEARRERMKTINREARRGDGWTARLDPPLTDIERRDLEMAARFNGVIGYPTYALSNLSGAIARTRQRLSEMEQAS